MVQFDRLRFETKLKLGRPARRVPFDLVCFRPAFRRLRDQIKIVLPFD